MTKRCFDTVWRQRRSRNRRKQSWLQQSIVHLFKSSHATRDQGSVTRVENGSSWSMAESVWRGVGGWRGGVGGYWSRCEHLLHLSAELSVWGKWGPGEVVWRAYVWWRGRRQQQKNKQVHKEFTCFFPTSLRLCRYTCGHLFSLLKWKQKRCHDFLNFVSSEERTDLREKALRLSADIAAKHCCIHWI